MKMILPGMASQQALEDAPNPVDWLGFGGLGAFAARQGTRLMGGLTGLMGQAGFDIGNQLMPDIPSTPADVRLREFPF
jgi:hypothetical protein